MRATILALAGAALAVSLSGAATDARAQSPSEDPYRLAEGLMAQGRPELACPLLRVTVGSAHPDPRGLYLLANCSRDVGQIDAAARYYEQLIALLPDAPKPRTELAALYLAQGRNEEARQLFAQAAANAQDPQVTTVLRGLVQQLSVDDPAALAARTPKRWAVDAFVGMTYDTNVNVGPSASTVAAVVGGVPIDLTLSPESAPQASWGATANIGGRYLMPLDNNFALLFQGAVSKTEYFSAHDFSTDGLALATALVYRDGGFSANLQPNIRWARQDDMLQEATYGLTGRVTQALGDGWSVTGSMGGFNRRVPPSRDQDAEGYLGSLGFGKTLFGGVLFSGEYLAQREKAENEVQSRLLHGPSLLLILPMTSRLEAVANYRFTRITYDEHQALFSEAREDSQHTASLALFWDLSGWIGYDVGLRAQYAYTRNHSNLAINDYDRQTVVFGIETRF